MTPLHAAAEKHNLGGYERHVLLCTGPKCCTEADGLKAWEALKQGIKEQQLEKTCFRTKVGCLRMCTDGPIAVVYPEGTWYRGMTAEEVPGFVREHLVENRPVERNVFARNPLLEQLADGLIEMDALDRIRQERRDA